MVLFKY